VNFPGQPAKARVTETVHTRPTVDQRHAAGALVSHLCGGPPTDYCGWTDPIESRDDRLTNRGEERHLHHRHCRFDLQDSENARGLETMDDSAT
jgi:hypothetical protein